MFFNTVKRKKIKGYARNVTYYAEAFRS